MAVLGASERDAIASSLAAGDVLGAFARLASHPDLKQTDLPTLDKRALARLGEDRATAAAFVAGLLSPSLSVRRMARKFAPKLAPHGPGALLLLLAEAVRPLRRLAGPGDGLAGDFDGWATPLGPAVMDAGLSFAVKNPNVAVYSPATRMVKDALEDLAAALVQAPAPVLVRAIELVLALARPFARVDPVAIPDAVPPGVEGLSTKFAVGVLVDPLRMGLGPRARKDDPATLAALERWARHELVLDDPAPEGSPEAALRERARALLPGVELARSASILAVYAASLLPGLSLERALTLYQRLKAGPEAPTDAHAWLMTFQLERFERDHPREASAPAPATLPALAPPGAHDLLVPLSTVAVAGRTTASKKKTTAATPPAPPPAPATATVDAPPLAPHLGPPFEWAVGALVPVAHALGLPDVWRRLIADADLADVCGDDDVPPRRGGPHAEATLEEARQALREHAREDDERARLATASFGRFTAQGRAFVPEAALDAPWADRLAPLLVEAPPSAALCAAMLLLPPRLIATHADAWRAACERLDETATYGVRDTADLVAGTRTAALDAVLGPVLELRARQHPPNADGTWQFAVALSYLCGGAAGRAAALRAIAAACVPAEKPYYRRHCFNAPFRLLVRRAWERRDADLLGVACSRALLPVYFKGKRAMLPDEERLRWQSALAPSEGTAPPGREVPLADVVAFVARERPALLAEGLAVAGPIAAYEKGARALLDLAPAAGASGADRLGDVVALLEAPSDAAVKSGLEMLVGLAPDLGARLDDVVLGLERAVTSASPGVVQAAAALLGSVAEAHPARRADAVRLLEECLMSPNVPTAEEAMRALARVLGAASGGRKAKASAAGSKKKTAKQAGAGKATKKKAAAVAGSATLSEAARERIAALAEDEPRRLGKLAAALLG